MEPVADGPEPDFDEMGDLDGVPLVLIGGLGSVRLAFDDDLALGFADRGFRVVRLGLRDLGRAVASRSHWALEDLVDQVVAVLDRREFERSIVLGWSLGSIVASATAASHPARVAALVSVAGIGDRWPEGVEATWLDPLSGYRVLSSAAWRDEEWFAARTNELDSSVPDGLESSRLCEALRVAIPVVEGLASAAVETLVVHGELDELVSPQTAREFAQSVPGAHHLEFEQMAHLLEPQMWPRLIAAVTAVSAAAEW